MTTCLFIVFIIQFVKIQLVFEDHLRRAILGLASEPEVINDLFNFASLGEHSPQRVQLAGELV